MISYLNMAWWLAYEELYGDMDKEYPIMSDKNRITPQESDEYDPIDKIELGVGEEIYEDLLPKGWDQPGAADTVDAGTLNLGYQYGESGADTLNLDFSHLPGGMGEDHIVLGDSKPEPDLTYKSQKYQED